MRIDFEDVVPDMVLDTDIMYGGAVLIPKGCALTPALIGKVKRFGITHIDVALEEKLKEQKTADTLNIEYTVNEELCDKVKESLMSNDIVEIEKVTDDMIGTVLNLMNIDGDFSNLKYDLQTFNNLNSLDHSVRLSIFSIVLATLYNDSLSEFDKRDSKKVVNVNDVAMAALLQDKGRNSYGPEIFAKIEAVANNEEKRKQYPGIVDIPTDRYEDKYIPIYSYCLLDKMPDVSETAKLMVLYSAETENGKGPLKATGYNNPNLGHINIGAKIIHICNLYDNFLSHFYHEGESFENIITILGQGVSAGAINEDLTNLFLEKFPVYPIGAKLELSNGEKAVVIKTFPGYTYTSRPVVKLLSTGEIIDLRYMTTLTVNCVSKEEASLEQVVDNQINEIKRR